MALSTKPVSIEVPAGSIQALKLVFSGLGLKAHESKRHRIAAESFIPCYVQGQQLVLGITPLLLPSDFPVSVS